VTDPLLEALHAFLKTGVPASGDRAAARKRAEVQKRYGRVDAIARKILPALCADELERLAFLIKRESRALPSRKPAGRPTITKEDSEKAEKFAYEVHASLMRPDFNFSSDQADEWTGLAMTVPTTFVSKRTAQRYRLRYAKKLRKADARNSKK
jgi:hypothetical protein